MTTLPPIPTLPPPLTPQDIASPLLVATAAPYNSVSKTPYQISKSPYVWFNRCLLYLSILFALLTIIATFVKKLQKYRKHFQNWAIGLLIVYVFLVIMDYNEYNQLSGSQILFF